MNNTIHSKAQEDLTVKQNQTTTSANKQMDSKELAKRLTTTSLKTNADQQQQQVAVAGKQVEVERINGTQAQVVAPASQTTVESITIRRTTATGQSGLQPADFERHNHLPVAVLVEPRNDESVQCDCQNCQFFSGWCCMPCAIVIIIVLIIVWASTRMNHYHEHHPTPTTLKPAMVTTTTSSLPLDTDNETATSRTTFGFFFG